MNRKRFIINIVLVLLLIVLASLNAYGTCTVTLDKTTYFVNETATAQMSCDNANEKTRAYTLTWRNDTTVLQTNIGTTPSTTGNLFFESYTITDAFNTGTVTLTGTNLEGSDTFTSTIAPSNTLIISNVELSNNFLLGKNACVDFDVTLGGNPANDARCFIDLHDNNGFTVFSSENIISYNGHSAFCSELKPQFFNEDTQTDSSIHCFFENNTFNTGTSASFFMNISHWLTVNTITDKTSYTLMDKQVLVCANVTNNGTRRIPLQIEYNYRCDGNDDDTDRVIADSHIELRGINANTTQNQCASLKIKNLKTMTNRVNKCYAATDVRVLKTSGQFGEILFTYPSTSPAFNITSTSSAVFSEGNNMGALPITIFILLVAGSLFSLPFIFKKFTNNEYANLILTRACFVIAIYLMMFNSAIMATIADATGLPLTKEMFQYMWMFGMVGYVAMGALVFKTLLDTLELWKFNKNKTRVE